MHTVDEEWLMVLYKNREAKQKSSFLREVAVW